MNSCMCACMHACMHACTQHTHTHTHTHTHIFPSPMCTTHTESSPVPNFISHSLKACKVLHKSELRTTRSTSSLRCCRSNYNSCISNKYPLEEKNTGSWQRQVRRTMEILQRCLGNPNLTTTKKCLNEDMYTLILEYKTLHATCS